MPNLAFRGLSEGQSKVAELLANYAPAQIPTEQPVHSKWRFQLSVKQLKSTRRKNYITEGDVMAVLSQRMTKPFQASPLFVSHPA